MSSRIRNLDLYHERQLEKENRKKAINNKNKHNNKFSKKSNKETKYIKIIISEEE